MTANGCRRPWPQVLVPGRRPVLALAPAGRRRGGFWGRGRRRRVRGPGTGSGAGGGSAAGVAADAAAASPTTATTVPTSMVSPSATRISLTTPAIGDGNLGVDLVGGHLEQRLVLGNGVTDLLEPLRDGALGDGLAELGKGDVSHVGGLCSCGMRCRVVAGVVRAVDSWRRSPSAVDAPTGERHHRLTEQLGHARDAAG